MSTNSLLDVELPRLSARFEAWSAPENFDADGRPRASLRRSGPSR